MRASKWRKRAKRAKRNGEPDKIVIKGTFGRCDLPTGGHGWAHYTKIVEQMLAEQRKRRRDRMKRGLTDKDPIGVNLFAVVVDEANYVTGPYRPYHDYEASDFDEKDMNQHANPLLALAEAAATRQEVIDVLTPIAENALHRAKLENAPPTRARQAMLHAMHSYLNGHHYGGFQRKKTCDKIAKKLLKNYQRKQRKVEDLTDKRVREAERKGEYAYRPYYRRQVIEEIWDVRP